MGVNSGSSFREQVLYFYMQRLFPDALNRYKHDVVGEIDIYIPSERVGIEYDGGYWHNKKLNLDNEKNQRAKEEGVRLIRIREYKLSPTENTFGEIYLQPYSDRSYDVGYLNYIFENLGDILEDNKIRTFSITEEGFKDDLPEIYSRIYSKPVDSNLTDMCGIELWDKDYNGELSPANIPEDEWAYAILRCKNEENIVLPRYHRDFREACKEGRKAGCENCISGLVCPLLQWCRGNNFEKGEIYDCPYVEKQIRKLIKAGKYYLDYEKGCHLTTWLWLKSDLGIKLVKEIMDLPIDDPKRNKYFKFLGIRYEEDKYGSIQKYQITVRNVEEVKLLEELSAQLKYSELQVRINPNMKVER